MRRTMFWFLWNAQLKVKWFQNDFLVYLQAYHKTWSLVTFKQGKKGGKDENLRLEDNLSNLIPAEDLTWLGKVCPFKKNQKKT